MSFSIIQEILKSNFSSKELEDEIIEIQRQIFNLRLQQASRQTCKPHSFKHARHKLAQLKMVKHYKSNPNKTYINCLKTEMKALSQQTDLSLKSTIWKKE